MSSRVKLAPRVCALVRQGASLRDIARMPRMPSLATLTRWLAEDAEFRDRYESALDVQRTLLADDVVAIADKGDDAKAIDRKMRIDARKWRVRVDAEDKALQSGPPDNIAEILADRWRRFEEEKEARLAAGEDEDGVEDGQDRDGDPDDA
ncbi:MAG: hypothetical protein ACM30I_14430 [Gemmatimonas sp.]